MQKFLYTNTISKKSAYGEIMAFWEAEYYDKNSKLQQEIAQNFLNLLKEKFEDFPFHCHLLDIGCGTGRVTKSIQSRFPKGRTTGVDASKEMIEFAIQNFSTANVHFYQDRAEELKVINNSSIDGIVSFSSLHWVHDHGAAFRAMHRVLRPGGQIGLTFCAETDIDDPLDHADS
jgi:ubiquinone/menaquinone biosynthesis C-methylase UbiE